MCGIVGYIGNKDPVPILLKGLKRLEYRGYDSSGIALLQDEKLAHIKRAGKVSDLRKNISVFGEDRETTIIDGNETASVVVFNSLEDSTAHLRGFTLTNGLPCTDL